MQDKCCICGTSEGLTPYRIFRPNIFKWASPSKDIDPSIFDSDRNKLPFCEQCSKRWSNIPPNKSIISSMYATAEEKAYLLKLYQRLENKIVIFNKMTFQTIDTQGGKCYCCGAHSSYTSFIFRRKSHNEPRSVHNMIAVCSKCNRQLKTTE